MTALYRHFSPTRHLESFTFEGWLGRCRLAVEDCQVIGYWHGTHDAHHGSTPLEHDLDHGFAPSWMMGRALVENPPYTLHALPQGQEAGRA